jgi:hypothetical protein
MYAGNFTNIPNGSETAIGYGTHNGHKAPIGSCVYQRLNSVSSWFLPDSKFQFPYHSNEPRPPRVVPSARF